MWPRGHPFRDSDVPCPRLCRPNDREDVTPLQRSAALEGGLESGIRRRTGWPRHSPVRFTRSEALGWHGFLAKAEAPCRRFRAVLAKRGGLGPQGRSWACERPAVACPSVQVRRTVRPIRGGRVVPTAAPSFRNDCRAQPPLAAHRRRARDPEGRRSPAHILGDLGCGAEVVPEIHAAMLLRVFHRLFRPTLLAPFAGIRAQKMA